MNDMTLVGSMLAVVCVFIVSWAECGFTYSLKCGTERVEQDDSGINIGINMGVGMVIMVTCAAGIGVNYFEDCNSLPLRNIADWAINKWWI